MAMKAYVDKVIISPIDPEDVTPSGLVLAPAKKPVPTSGRVVSVGPKGECPMDIEEGQVAFFKEFAGAEVEREGEKYYILHYTDLLAVEA
jgi:chaperonin GroES